MTMNGVERPQEFGDPITFSVVYALDGSEGKNTVPSPSLGQRPLEMISTARWQGETLVTATWTAAAGAARKTVRAMHLTADGVLLVESISTAPEGVSPATSTSTTAYRKSK